MKVDQLEVRIYDTRLQMGEAAAKEVATKIRELQDIQEQINIIFASAPSQNEFLDVLSQEPGLSWNKVNAFHMDEYVGIAEDAPQNFGHFLKVRLFDKVGCNNTFYLNGNNDDLVQECNLYSNLLTQYPTDIVCMGIGENTHIAFNDPFVAKFNDPALVKSVELDLASRVQQVNDKCFEELDEVPTHAITLSVPALMKARYAYCIVPTDKKASAIQHTLESPISEEFPSTILRKHPHATLFIDRDSSGKLSKISS